jgi:poly-gamma-glutamate synthase PgsB/CapB
MDHFTGLALITIVLVVLGAWESFGHRSDLRKIPIRIHVYGTRGKSSVTRLIAAGLRAGDIRTCAKITGASARFISPDGDESTIQRWQSPNVIEQKQIVRRAASLDAEALVVECMAIQPELHWICEAKLIRATHGVMTNARSDHLDAMGPSRADVARALAGATPIRARLYCAERGYADIIRQAAKDRETALVQIDSNDIESISADDMTRFPHLEFPENVATALKVCEDLGVDRRTALRGMREAEPDPGAMTAHRFDFGSNRFIFVNGFAANDIESAGEVWRRALERFPDVNRRIVLVNCRGDRRDRSRQFGRACADWRNADRYVLVGSGRRSFAQAAFAGGAPLEAISFASGRHPPKIGEIVADLAGPSSLVVGVGNIGGIGLDLAHYFARASDRTGTA